LGMSSEQNAACSQCRASYRPLHTAAELGHLSCMQALLMDVDADVNESDQSGCTPLVVACSLGHADCAEFLLKSFADANHFDARGVPVLFTACLSGSSACVTTLLRWGADANSKTALRASAGCNGGRSPLWAACTSGNLESVRQLCAYGALRVWQRREEQTLNAEMVAARAGHDHVVQWLKITRAFTTPLHYADVVTPARARALLRGGANLHARCIDMTRTPIEIATELVCSGRAAAGSAAELILQASRPWSPATHGLFPASARRFAVELVVLGAALARSERFTGSALEDVWVEHVMPHAVLRPYVRWH